MKLSNLTILILVFFLFIGFLGFLVHCNQDAIKKNADEIQKIQDDYVTSQTLSEVEQGLQGGIDVIFGKQEMFEIKVGVFERMLEKLPMPIMVCPECGNMWASNTLNNAYDPWPYRARSKTTPIAKE